MVKRLAKTANVQEVLVYYDGPQVLLLRTDRDNPMLAVAINRQGKADPFFACEVRDKALERYLLGKADLHYLFATARSDAYYLFDLDDADGKRVGLTVADEDEATNAEFWPATGIFSSIHTSVFGLVSKVASGTQAFRIDGRWEATEFSYFYGKFADLYAIAAIFGETWDGLNDELKEIVFGIVKSKLWRGGGSYVGFYDQLMSSVTSARVAPLNVKEISYASPGKLVLSGESSVLNCVRHFLDTLDDRQEKLAKEYRDIRGILAAEKLLRAKPQAAFSSNDVRKLVKKKTDDFGKSLGIDYCDVLYQAAGRKTLVYSKMVLSIYRRAKEVHAFHAEGRMQPLDR